VEEKMKKNIIFIICCPRSGSTWLGNLLGKHKDIEYHNEPGILSWLNVKEVTEPMRLNFKKIVMRMCSGQKTNHVFKFPHWTLFIEELISMFPEAKFIHIIRNSKNVALSLNKVRKTNPETNYHNVWFLYQFDKKTLERYKKASFLKKDIITWEHYTSKAFQAKELGEERYIEVSYEDLVEFNTLELKRISMFLELKGDESWFD
jgi:hypothetical protein